MPKLEGAVPSKLPIAPPDLQNKIRITATYEITEREAFLYHRALKGLDLQLKEQGVDYSKLPEATAIFTRDGKFTILPDGDELGYKTCLLIYCVQKWRDVSYTDEGLLIIFLEELCHHFLNIDDEEIVKHKVVEVINRITEKKLTFEDLFASDWKKGYPDLYPENE
ncbi:hypothetical protein [Bacillus anthracis]|uniref:hypothetical protein n=1 Tax=Bacillus anthracis TaxID=1392 RepID=UPI0008FE6C74|nr:hypothetical protein [Bacillus anthracis]AXO97173.1 hypothetical protein DY470_05365 [Bacillus anthracis]OJD84753.1 hypothetical protein A9486_22860 [Bacillus anthracis]